MSQTDPLLQGLNTAQEKSIKECQNPVLVLAGAGCGKTTVITQKIRWLIQREYINSSRIAAITFTNKAAKEMQTRLQSVLPKNQYKQLTVSTFHSLGLELLREHYEAINYNKNFSLVDAQDASLIIRDIAIQFGISDTKAIKNVQWQISKFKNEDISPLDAKDLSEDKLSLIQADIYQSYQTQLESYQFVDFDDLLLKPLQLLRINQSVQDNWCRKFKHILIDEYQDTNNCQYNLLKQLVSPEASFTVVGDDNQAVYEWRGANPKNLLNLEIDFPTLKIIPLEQNYRSTNQILKASNDLIQNNESILKKSLWSELGEGDAVQLHSCEHAKDEAEKIISLIRSQRFKDSSVLGDFCILYRSNHQAEQFEKVLRQKGIDYQVSGGMSLFDRVEIKNIVAYIRLMVNPNDDVSFLRIINTPRREIGEKTISTLMKYKQKIDISLFESCSSFGLAGIFDEKICGRLNYFSEWLDEQRNQINQNVKQGMQELLKSIDYYNWLKTQATNTKSAELQIQRVENFVEWMCLINEHNPDYDLVDLVRHLNLIERLEVTETKEDEKVKLMTIHSAKGLEFPYVYLVGMEEGVLPHHNSVDNEDSVIEERRLVYVAMTRAKKSLSLSYSQKKLTYKGSVTLQQSRFISEISDEYINMGVIKMTTTEKKYVRNKALTQMKDMFE